VPGAIIDLPDQPPPRDMQTYGSAGRRSTRLSQPWDNRCPREGGHPMRPWSLALLGATVLCLSGCGYNNLQSQDENVKAAWSEVVNQYQRRADLVPNLVNTVKGYAAQEQKVLISVTEARAKVGSIQVTPEMLNNPEQFQKYEAAQGELTSALKSLLVVKEAYPDLKSDQNFRDLQAQLEGTENRITVARNRYIQAVQGYNVTVRSFPTNLTAKVFGFPVKPNFTVANEQQISTAPTVSFDTTTPASPAAPAAPPQTK
jgi:LemA protein